MTGRGVRRREPLAESSPRREVACPRTSRGVSRCRLRHAASERGAGTVLAMMIVMVLVVAVWVAGALSAGVTARRSAAAAADLAALAVADHAARGSPDPCAAGDRIAVANDGRLVDCVLLGHNAEVVVEVLVPDGPFGWVPDGRRRARAGPESPLGVGW